ncbi:MAG: phospholipase D-like domain-containing protein [Desulfuromonadales bacterium]|nr:phospholipase D-like domain-containing protein [Desulfuromonadales bacterium]
MLIYTFISAIPYGGYAFAKEISYPAKVTLLSNREYVTELISGIRHAKKEIQLCFFLFKVNKWEKGLPMKVVQELIAASRRGVDITVVLERDSLKKDSIYDQNILAASLLSSNGVKVRFDSPQVVTHAKAVVIDNRYLYLGSHNITQSALKYNNELSVLIDSPELAREVKSYIEHL